MDKQIIMIDYALAYMANGMHVFPVEWRTDIPKERHKQPLTKWKHLESHITTEAEIRSWWGKWALAGIGWVTGAVPGIVVIDVESAAGYEALRSKYGELPDTLMQRTGKEGGFHLIYRHPRDGRFYQNQTKIKIDGVKVDVDTRGDGGFIVVAPSMHPFKKRYAWSIDPLIDPRSFGLIVDLPERLMEIFSPYVIGTKSKKKQPGDGKKESVSGNFEKKNPDGWVQDFLWGVDEGQRNDWAAKLTGWYLRSFKGDVDQVKEIMRALNERNRPPLDWVELEKTIDSIAGRQATCEMGDELGEDIDKIEVLEYPDGSRKYNVYLENVKGYAQLSLKELGQFTIFKWRFGDLAGYIPSPVKQNTWEDKVNKALNEAKHIPISTEETNMGIVMSAIDRAIASRDVSSDLKHLNTRIVLVGENGDQRIFLQISTLMGAIKFEGEKLTRTQVGEILRKLGFDNKLPARTTVTSTARIWTSSLIDWERRKGVL